MRKVPNILIVLLTFQLFAQTIDTWERRYGDEMKESGKQIIRMNDGNFLINANKIVDDYGFTDMIWLIEVDQNGDSLWTKLIGDSVLNRYINDLSQNSSGDLFVASGCDQGGLGQTAFISKKTSDYDEIWTDEYWNMPSLGVGVTKVVCTPDSGCAVIVRKLEGFDAAYSWIDKLSKDGKLEFSSTAIFTKEKYYDEHMNDMVLTDEGDYLVVISRAGLDISQSQHIVRLDDSLQVKGIMQFGDSIDELGIEEGYNNNFIVFSSSSMLKIDQELSIVWEIDLEGYSKSVVKSADGNYFVSGNSYTYKIDDDGNILWTKEFGCRSLVPTDDGGCMAVGTKFDDVWICKFDQDGNYTNINDYVYPDAVELHQNYPNPFNPSTEISYSLKSEGMVTLTVFNTKGELVSTLVNEKKTVGNHSINFNSEGLNSGIYFYRLNIDGKNVQSRKMMMLK